METWDKISWPAPAQSLPCRICSMSPHYNHWYLQSCCHGFDCRCNLFGTNCKVRKSYIRFVTKSWSCNDHGTSYSWKHAVDKARNVSRYYFSGRPPSECTGCSKKNVFFSKNFKYFETSTTPALLGCYWLYKIWPANKSNTLITSKVSFSNM